MLAEDRVNRLRNRFSWVGFGELLTFSLLAFSVKGRRPVGQLPDKSSVRELSIPTFEGRVSALKRAIISDIHGNLEAVTAVLARHRYPLA